MKRIHLFEFEDFPWFPNWLRIRMTRLIMVMHKILGSSEEVAKILAPVLKTTNTSHIIDLCSGSGGPMPEVVKLLEEKYGMKDIQLTLTDLYPNKDAATKINSENNNVSYHTTPLDATKVNKEMKGLRAMVCSFHHMKPAVASKILASAQKDRQPICIFEISDNSQPIFLWWVALPINFVLTFFITPFVRPMTWQQLVFTYLIPVIPFCFAWDGAASNPRTYTLNDLEELLKGTQQEDYKWEKGVIKGKTRKIYLLGVPTFKKMIPSQDKDDKLIHSS